MGVHGCRESVEEESKELEFPDKEGYVEGENDEIDDADADDGETDDGGGCDIADHCSLIHLNQMKDFA